MRAGGGKSKGSNFEREVCKSLSRWISRGEREDVFWRSSMSGGRATVAMKSGIQLNTQAGDISPISALGELLLNTFVVECKFYTDLQLFQGITKSSGTLYKFWQHHVMVGRQFSKYPILIARQNMMPAVCLMPDYILPAFGLSSDNVVAALPHWEQECVVILFDAFLREAGLPELSVYTPAKRRARL